MDGAVNYLGKPFTPSELAAKVREVVDDAVPGASRAAAPAVSAAVFFGNGLAACPEQGPWSSPHKMQETGGKDSRRYRALY